MATIYKTKDGDVFACEHHVERADGSKYALDLTRFPKISAYNIASLTTLGNDFIFIENFYPGYSQSQKIAELDDLDCLLAEECDDEKVARVTDVFGSDPRQWKIERERLYSEILSMAIEAYYAKG